jgi:hypothetical protein
MSNPTLLFILSILAVFCGLYLLQLVCFLPRLVTRRDHISEGTVAYLMLSLLGAVAGTAMPFVLLHDTLATTAGYFVLAFVLIGTSLAYQPSRRVFDAELGLAEAHQ